MLAGIKKNSYFLLSIIKLGDMFYKIKIRLVGLYNDSHTDKLIRYFSKGNKNNFKHCFFARISDANLQKYMYILENCRFINWSFALFKTCKLCIINNKRNSVIVNFALGKKEELKNLSVKSGGIIVITSLFTNMFFSILIGKKTEIFELFIQSLILFICFSIIFCTVNWREIKNSSVIVKNIKI